MEDTPGIPYRSGPGRVHFKAIQYRLLPGHRAYLRLTPRLGRSLRLGNGPSGLGGLDELARREACARKPTVYHRDPEHSYLAGTRATISRAVWSPNDKTVTLTPWSGARRDLNTFLTGASIAGGVAVAGSVGGATWAISVPFLAEVCSADPAKCAAAAWAILDCATAVMPGDAPTPSWAGGACTAGQYLYDKTK